jgi:alkylation response protein AidB-like acyl-CoA dehydrogenase
MQYLPNEKVEQIRAKAREFAEKEFPPFSTDCDRREAFPFELWKKGCQSNLVGVYIDREYGGAGLGFFGNAIVAEEFWRVDPGCGQVLVSVTVGSEMIQLFGTVEQKERYLRPLTRGDALMGAAITEPDAGSDVSSVSTSARRAGNDYVISGNKMFITNGTIANFLAVLCLTNPQGSSRHERHSTIMVETDREGYEANKLNGKLGIRASDTAEVSFSDVRVPQSHLLGHEGKGFYQVMAFFNLSRTYVAAYGVGVAQGALERSIAVMTNKKNDSQAFQFRVAEMATQIEAARTLVYRAAWLVDQGVVDPRLIAMSKWYSGEMAVRVTGEAMVIFGRDGAWRANNIERFYRDAKIIEIFEGTKDMEKTVVARSVLSSIGRS